MRNQAKPKSSSTLLTMGKIITFLALSTLIGCAAKPGISTAVNWSKLHGWQQDDHRQLLPPLLLQCPKLKDKQKSWKTICLQAQSLTPDDSTQIKLFFQKYFQPHKIVGYNRSKTGMITGYYEPLLQGSYVETPRFNYPLYKKPDNLIKLAASANLLKVKASRARGRVHLGQTLAYYSRAQIDGPNRPLAGSELLWVDSSDDAFFLHIQGSGLVQMTDGSVVGVGYAEQNGHPYRAIGRDLIEMQQISKEDISLQSIKAWLVANPDRATQLKNKNPSYIFFHLRLDIEQGPRGSLNVPLTPERSVAVDRKIIPLGSPLWLSTHLPDSSVPYQRLVFAQDTGGAIKGPIRADVFFGRGERAEILAGTMKQQGSIFILLPK